LAKTLETSVRFQNRDEANERRVRSAFGTQRQPINGRKRCVEKRDAPYGIPVSRGFVSRKHSRPRPAFQNRDEAESM